MEESEQDLKDAVLRLLRNGHMAKAPDEIRSLLGTLEWDAPSQLTFLSQISSELQLRAVEATAGKRLIDQIHCEILRFPTG